MCAHAGACGYDDIFSNLNLCLPQVVFQTVTISGSCKRGRKKFVPVNY